MRVVWFLLLLCLAGVCQATGSLSLRVFPRVKIGGDYVGHRTTIDAVHVVCGYENRVEFSLDTFIVVSGTPDAGVLAEAVDQASCVEGMYQDIEFYWAITPFNAPSLVGWFEVWSRNQTLNVTVEESGQGFYLWVYPLMPVEWGNPCLGAPGVFEEEVVEWVGIQLFCGDGEPNETSAGGGWPSSGDPPPQPDPLTPPPAGGGPVPSPDPTPAPGDPAGDPGPTPPAPEPDPGPTPNPDSPVEGSPGGSDPNSGAVGEDPTNAGDGGAGPTRDLDSYDFEGNTYRDASKWRDSLEGRLRVRDILNGLSPGGQEENWYWDVPLPIPEKWREKLLDDPIIRIEAYPTQAGLAGEYAEVLDAWRVFIRSVIGMFLIYSFGMGFWNIVKEIK